MVKRTNKSVTGDIGNFSESIKSASFFPEQFPANRSNSHEPTAGDDLIVLLSDAYENKRARQVIEWEDLRRQTFQRAV